MISVRCNQALSRLRFNTLVSLWIAVTGPFKDEARRTVLEIEDVMAADAMGVEESQARLVHEEKAPCPILKAMATRGNQRPSEAIRGYQGGYIRGN